MGQAIIVTTGFVLMLAVPVGVLCAIWAFWLSRAGKLSELRLIVFGAFMAFLISLLFFVDSMSDFSSLAIGGKQLVENGQLTVRGFLSCLTKALLSMIVGVFVAQVCFRVFKRGVA